MECEYSPHWSHSAKLDPARCRASVQNDSRTMDWHQCYSKPWKGTWCKVHHPDTEAKRRELSSKLWDARCEAKLAPYRELELLRSRLATATKALEEIVSVLGPEVPDCCEKHHAGSAVEMEEALDIARRALDSLDKQDNKGGEG